MSLSSGLETGKVHFKDKIRQKRVNLAHPSSRILLGICTLNGLRIDCTLETVSSATPTIKLNPGSDVSRPIDALCSWLKLSPNEDEVKCGRHDFGRLSCRQQATLKVVFQRPFSRSPNVTAWFHKFDVSGLAIGAVAVATRDVTSKGFTIQVETSAPAGSNLVITAFGVPVYGEFANTATCDVGVSWIAFPHSREDVTCGTYNVTSITSAGQTVGHVSFADACFNSPPQLFLAIAATHLTQRIGSHELRATKVTAEGFDWQVETRDGSAQSLTAAYVAFPT